MSYIILFFFLYFIVPKVSPKGVTCKGVTSAGIELKWNLLPLEALKGRLTSYKIHYQEGSAMDLKDSKLFVYFRI